MPDVGGRIVFELCIRMIMRRLPPPMLRHLLLKVIMPASAQSRTSTVYSGLHAPGSR
jgi:hypothetical protein